MPSKLSIPANTKVCRISSFDRFFLNPYVVFFCFERYCSEPNEVLAKLYSIIDLDVVTKPIERFIPKMFNDSGVEKDILDECEEFFLMGSGTINSHLPLHCL